MHTTFYGDYAAFVLDVSVSKQTIQLKIAPTLSGQRHQGKPKPGERIYNWEQNACAFFSLMPTECAYILGNWNSILDGTFINPKEQDPQRAKSLSLVHFLNNQPSRLIVTAKTPQTLQFSILNPSKSIVGFLLRPYEMPVVQSFIEHGMKDLPFFSSFVDSYKIMEWKLEQERKNRNNDQRNSGGYNNNQNYGGNQGYNNQQSQPIYTNNQSQYEEGPSYDDLPPLDTTFSTSPQPTQQSQAQQTTQRPTNEAVQKLDKIDFGF